MKKNFKQKSELKNPAGSDHVWLPLHFDEVPSETIKVVNTVIDKIPDLPLSVNKIIEMASDENCDLGKFVELVSSDPMLVSNILRVVNSSYYGLSHKTDNLHLAIVLLGFKEVRKIALRSYISRTLGSGKTFKSYDTKQLWVHSYLVSTCAETFSSEDDQQYRGVLLTLGLLHDISKFTLYDIAMLLKKRGIKPQDTKDLSEPSYLLEKEEKLFGVNHTIVGGMLARKWNLSERFISVLECHHHPSFFDRSEIPSEFEKEISAICISDLIVNNLFYQNNSLPLPQDHFFETVGFHPPLESIINQELEKKLNDSKDFMSDLD